MRDGMMIDLRKKSRLRQFAAWFRACRSSGFGRFESIRAAARFTFL